MRGWILRHRDEGEHVDLPGLELDGSFQLDREEFLQGGRPLRFAAQGLARDVDDELARHVAQGGLVDLNRVIAGLRNLEIPGEPGLR